MLIHGNYIQFGVGTSSFKPGVDHNRNVSGVYFIGPGKLRQIKLGCYVLSVDIYEYVEIPKRRSVPSIFTEI